MQILQLITLGLFVLFSGLTAFFQLRAGMKDGQAARTDTVNAAQDAERHTKLARLCAIASVVLLLICIAIGAMNR